MRIDREWLVPINAPLVEFGGIRAHPLGVVTLSVIVGDYPQQITRDVTVLDIDYSFVYNGQVEVINRSLLKIIKTRLEGAKAIWQKELPSVLWAYRTMARTPTRETQF